MHILEPLKNSEFLGIKNKKRDVYNREKCIPSHGVFCNEEGWMRLQENAGLGLKRSEVEDLVK